jgi:peptide/nickel transport system permease protein
MSRKEAETQTKSPYYVTEGITAHEIELMGKRRSQSRIIFDRFRRNRAAVLGASVLLLLALAALSAPLLLHQTTSYDPSTALSNDLLQPPSLAHPLGTDAIGRDELARLLYGARVSLSIATVSMLVALVFGVGIGAVAGYYGGIVDTVLMRFTDMVLAVPYLLILSVLSLTFVHGSYPGMVLLLASFAWAGTARLVRGEFLALKEREFVLAARTLGASDLRLMVHDILPNALAPIIVTATLLIGDNIIAESVLSFFGFGLQIPLASWGTMLNDSQTYFAFAPWMLWAPGMAIVITVLCVNLVGDGLRDAFDPSLTER